MTDKWIQEAIEKPGSLREYIRRKYGKRAFTSKGTIKVTYLRKLLRSKTVDEKTKRRARLALTLRKLRKR